MRQSGVLPLLSSILEPEKVYQCGCGSHAFFSWGIKLVNKESFGNLPRLQDTSHDSEVMICAKCHKPVVMMAGDMYDASEYISEAEVHEIIQYGQSREHVAPLRAMDP